MSPPRMEETRLNLAHQGLKTVPQTLLSSFRDRVTILDLTNNQIRDVSFLSSFREATCLILDHNPISGSTVFPLMPRVTVLWLNHCQIDHLERFLPRLRTSFPRLSHLSLMGNPCAAPPHEDRFYDYLCYRLYVLFWFQDLDHLDERPVIQDERQEALRLFRRDLLDKLGALTSSAAEKLRRLISPAPRPNLI